MSVMNFLRTNNADKPRRPPPSDKRSSSLATYLRQHESQASIELHLPKDRTVSGRVAGAEDADEEDSIP